MRATLASEQAADRYARGADLVAAFDRGGTGGYRFGGDYLWFPPTAGTVSPACGMTASTRKRSAW
jgi:hypothetical protein